MRSLDEYSTLELHSELRRRKEAAPTNPIDYWWVATEIGVEGARLERFGKYYGHFAEVALRFADKVGYGLYLNRARILSDLPPLPSSEAEARIWYKNILGPDVKARDAVEAMKVVLSGSEYEVREGRTHQGTVIIRRKSSEKKEMTR